MDDPFGAVIVTAGLRCRMSRQCWICGGDATSREHRIKKSDIKSVLRHFDQKRPVFLHVGGRQNLRIGSANSDLLKFEKSLCEPCNNARTQNADRAWERLSKAINDDAVDTSAIDSMMSDPILMAEVHKYFMKHMGCIMEAGVKIPEVTQNLGDCLLDDRNSSNLFLVLGRLERRKDVSLVHTNPNVLRKVDDLGKVVVTYRYVVGRASIGFVYSNIGRPRNGGWNPNDLQPPSVVEASHIDPREIYVPFEGLVTNRGALDVLTYPDGTIEIVSTSE